MNNTVMLRDRLEAVISPTRVTDIWTVLGTTIVAVPTMISDEKQSPIAHATGASRVDMVRFPDLTLVFLEM